MAPDAAAAAAAAAGHGRRGAQLVWFTGTADLRVGDHGGLLDAIAAAAAAGATGKQPPIWHGGLGRRALAAAGVMNSAI